MFRSARDSMREPVNDDSSLTFICGYCEEGGWNSETELVIHKKTFHKMEISAIAKQRSQTACMTCSSTFTNKELICHYKEAHLHSSRNAETVERETFICDHCYIIFFNKQLLEMHMGMKHLKLPVLNCPICKKRLKRSAMWTHLETHKLHSVSVCPICLLKCKNIAALNKHVMTHPKYYNCNLCGFVTTKEASYTSHLKRYMVNEAKDEEYAQLDVNKYYLMPKSHFYWRKALWSFGAKGLILFNNLYICVLCRHICTDITECQKHIYTRHMTPPPAESVTTNYVCVCGEQFTSNIMLKQHVLKLKEPHRDIKSTKTDSQ